MNKINADIWGRAFQLEVSFDQYSGESITKEQKEALDAFCDKISEAVNEAKPDIIEYCAEKSDENLRFENNVFRFIIPKCIYVIRAKNGEHKVALLFSFKYDTENMVAAVFENEKLIQVTTDSAIL